MVSGFSIISKTIPGGWGPIDPKVLVMSFDGSSWSPSFIFHSMRAGVVLFVRVPTSVKMSSLVKRFFHAA